MYGNLSGMSTITGPAGGEIITGGTASGDVLILRSTTNGTKGSVIFDETTPSTSTTTGAVIIAGGIGITPFRSMIKYCIDTNEKRDIVLLYSNKTITDIVYEEVFDEAQTK